MSEPFWLDEPWQGVSRRRSSARAEIAVIGAGVTGCACALELARSGRRVRIYEARRVASGASGRNGGFALRGASLPYDAAVRRLGRSASRSLWLLTERFVDRMAELGGDAFRRTGSLRLAADATERDELASEYEALREDGFAVEWIEELGPPLAGRFSAALLHPADGSLHPGRWVRRLAGLAAEAGAEIVEHTRVGSLAELDADQVVIATDGYTRGLLPALDGAVRPTRGQVIVTEPLRRILFERPHYARRGYDYWQQTADGRVVIGGWRDTDLEGEFTSEEVTTPAIQSRIETFLAELLGTRPAITHRWAGIFGTTDDGLPLVGRIPGSESVWVACGYSGHGNVMGLACGELVARAIAGEPAPELGLFDPGRALLPSVRETRERVS